MYLGLNGLWGLGRPAYFSTDPPGKRAWYRSLCLILDHCWGGVPSASLNLGRWLITFTRCLDWARLLVFVGEP